MDKRAVVLLSGGMDSATAAAVARSNGFELYALTFDYGQRHRKELWCARALARFFKAREHRVLRIGLGKLGGSALTDRAIEVPDAGGGWTGGRPIPATYVPARNLVLLSFAAAYAETVGAGTVFIGANAVDYSGYPDCRSEFLRAFEEAARLGTKCGVSGRPLRVEAPLLRLSKAQVVRLGASLLVPFDLTWSCYRGGKRPCRRCDSCHLRAKGFEEAGMVDPVLEEGSGRKAQGARDEGARRKAQGAKAQGGRRKGQGGMRR
ncbi:MAG: 7-cyano-7-deazaguanine synthase QueC [Euryarchaeota archaeon]|nr:7-cyano-7-deazaguanine synthase QueC [Euryarchaeota archaeon]